MNCMKRFSSAILEDKYLVTMNDWTREAEFADKVISKFNDNTSNYPGISVPPMKGKPTMGYLGEMTRLFFIQRYNKENNKDWRKWCRENPGKILVIEVVGDAKSEKPCQLEMQYEKGFWLRLM
ncbi:hypothetical protein PHG31p163 [Aeromonas phage 31]|uniref:Uncharacterized protein n=3 Tax=Biquartavirus 44RR2 TaxID=115987 RepID=Q6U9D7_9CAUD|nr:hypothetical protein ST44RRORF165c [Aeromonas phage 44RR2.8t]YP_238892.1 hypothetical protein PHG31p163 [Aeromonas phage 31]APU00637.1 hypothetical protein [Aeromonas phage 44RR2.8t.2]APU01057.1 hypothetical protein [Aeromonas phage 31.2]APU01967.1 hypothetical protein [Aeromonas phage L9-6]APU02219.1 hypothetical protein [Aeromonas phage Riv-10]APU02465.1 hypothetical protein [Aeromonas phage SW69-9]